MQEISERLAGEGHNVSVYTTNAADIDYFFSDARVSVLDAPFREIIHNVNVTRWKILHPPFRKLLLSAIAMLPQWQTKCLFHPYQMLVPQLLSKSLREKGFDVVHATASPFTSLLFMGYNFAKTNNIPYILTPFIHLGEEGDVVIRREHTKQHQLKLLRKADALLVQTRSEGDFLAQSGNPEERIYHVGVGVNPNELAGGNGKRFRNLYSVSDEEKLLGHIARLDAHKGTLQLLEALQILLVENRKVKAVLLGKPTPDFKKNWMRIPEIIKKNCIVLDYLDEEGKNDMLDAIDIFVMPSRVESFGIVYLESWLNRKPVIGADTTATREVIADGEDGFLVKFGDARALAEKISFLLDHPEVGNRMGEHGYKKTITQHTWDKKYTLIKSVYSGVINRFPKRI